MRRHHSHYAALAVLSPCAAAAVWLAVAPKARALNESAPPSFRFARGGLRSEEKADPPLARVAPAFRVVFVGLKPLDHDGQPQKVAAPAPSQPELFAALGTRGETSPQPITPVPDVPSGTTDGTNPVDGWIPANRDRTPESPPPGSPMEAPRTLPARPEEEPQVRIPTALDVPTVDPRKRFYQAALPGEISAQPATLFGEEQTTRFSEGTTRSKGSLHFRVAVSLVADDNVSVSNVNRQSDVILSVAPTVLMKWGSGESDLTVTAIYTPSGVFFMDHSSENSFDQIGSIHAQYHFSRLTLGLHLSVTSVNGSSLDVGDRVSRNSYYAGVTSSYAISDKTSLELNADYSASDFSGLLGSSGTRAEFFVNYLLSPKLKLGIGGGFGVLEVDGGGTQTSEQWLFHAIYNPTEKTSIHVSGGGEFRQITGGPTQGPDPVFSIGAAWTPTEKLTFTLDARRRTYGSAALLGQNYTATGIVAGVTDNLTHALAVSLAIGYEHDEYQSAKAGVVATRRDDYWYVRPSLDWHALPRLNVGVFYEFSTNRSIGEGARPFDRNRAGVMASYSF